MIDTGTRFLVENTSDKRKRKWLELPFDEDEFDDLLTSIGVTDGNDGLSSYDRLMGDVEFQSYQIVDFQSFILPNDCFDTIFEANELVKRIEELEDWHEEALVALIEDGYDVKRAIDDVEDVDFYPNTSLKDLAEQFADEGIFSDNYLLQFVDFDGVARDMSFEGYREVNGGVLRS